VEKHLIGVRYCLEIASIIALERPRGIFKYFLNGKYILIKRVSAQDEQIPEKEGLQNKGAVNKRNTNKNIKT
jgi:hypothetical protein